MWRGSSFYFSHHSQAGVGAPVWLQFGHHIPGREVPEDTSSPVVVVVLVVGAPPWAGDPKGLLSSFSHAREFLPLDGSIRARKCPWETLQERGPSSQETFLSGYLALGRFALGLRTCEFRSFVLLPLMLHSLPCSVLGTDPAPQDRVPGKNTVHLPLCPLMLVGTGDLPGWL